MDAQLRRELGRKPTPEERRAAVASDSQVVDPVVVERAVSGHRAVLNQRELEQVVWRLANQRQWGLKVIARHTGYSPSHINAIMKRQGLV